MNSYEPVGSCCIMFFVGMNFCTRIFWNFSFFLHVNTKKVAKGIFFFAKLSTPQYWIKFNLIFFLTWWELQSNYGWGGGLIIVKYHKVHWCHANGFKHLNTKKNVPGFYIVIFNTCDYRWTIFIWRKKNLCKQKYYLVVSITNRAGSIQWGIYK